MYCSSGFVEDVTIREDSPSSQSDDSGPSWGPLEAAFGLAPEEVVSTKYNTTKVFVQVFMQEKLAKIMSYNERALCDFNRFHKIFRKVT